MWWDSERNSSPRTRHISAMSLQQSRVCAALFTITFFQWASKSLSYSFLTCENWDNRTLVSHGINTDWGSGEEIERLSHNGCSLIFSLQWSIISLVRRQRQGSKPEGRNWEQRQHHMGKPNPFHSASRIKSQDSTVFLFQNGTWEY